MGLAANGFERCPQAQAHDDGPARASDARWRGSGASRRPASTRRRAVHAQPSRNAAGAPGEAEAAISSQGKPGGAPLSSAPRSGTLAQPRSRGPQRCASSASRFARTRGGAKSAAAPKMPHPQERRAVRPARDRVRPPDAGPLIRVLVFVGSGGKCPQGRETTLARHRVVMLSRRGWEPFGYGGCAVAIVRIGPLWWFRF